MHACMHVVSHSLTPALTRLVIQNQFRNPCAYGPTASKFAGGCAIAQTYFTLFYYTLLLYQSYEYKDVAKLSAKPERNSNP